MDFWGGEKKLPRDLTVEPEENLLAFFHSNGSKLRPFLEITSLLNAFFPPLCSI